MARVKPASGDRKDKIRTEIGGSKKRKNMSTESKRHDKDNNADLFFNHFSNLGSFWGHLFEGGAL